MISAETLLFDDFRVATIAYTVYLDIHVPMTSMITIKKTLMAKDAVLVDLTIIAFVCSFDALVLEYSYTTATVMSSLVFFHFFGNGIIF